MVTVKNIGMANLVLERRAFPELVQGDLRASAVRSVLESIWVEGAPARTQQFEAMEELRLRLGRGGAASGVARLARDLLES